MTEAKSDTEAKPEHSLPYLPAGRYIVDCVSFSRAEIPCIATISCERESGAGQKECVFFSPVTDPSALSELQAIMPLDILVGATKVKTSSNKDAEGSIPNGHYRLFDTTLFEKDRALIVEARYWTPEGQLKTRHFHLQYNAEKFGRRFVDAVQEWMLQEGNIEKFLSAQEFLESEIRKGEDHVLTYPKFDRAMALACLERNLYNRGLIPTYLERYISDMTNNKWGRPSDAICFTHNGKLIEGAHRSIATVISGVSGAYQSLAFNYDEDAMQNFNKGAQRNEAGNHDIKQRRQAVEGVRDGELDLTKLQKGTAFTKVQRNMVLIQTESNSKTNRAYQDAFLNEYYRDHAWYNLAEAGVKASFIRKDNGVIGACFVLTHRKYPEIIEDVFHRVTSASGLEPGTALHTLHSILANEAAENSKGNLSLGLVAKILICLHRHVEHVLQDAPNDYTFVKGRKTEHHRKQARAFFTYEVTDANGRVHRTFLPDSDPEIVRAHSTTAEVAAE